MWVRMFSSTQTPVKFSVNYNLGMDLLRKVLMDKF
jgi:hypothetical protein